MSPLTMDALWTAAACSSLVAGSGWALVAILQGAVGDMVVVTTRAALALIDQNMIDQAVTRSNGDR